MKLKERRMFQVINHIRDAILDSETDIGTRMHLDIFREIERKYSEQEVRYALRYLEGKNYLGHFRAGDSDYTLTSKGYDEWLFPNGPIDYKSIFISYAVEDKILAGKLKELLEKNGLKVFLAHEGIEPTAEWRDKIISDLKSCNIFIALQTKTYIIKQYTEQECGFALALNKRILSLCIGIKSEEMGFCSEFQGKFFSEGDENEILKYCERQVVPFLGS